jgi:hypothetical protein
MSKVVTIFGALSFAASLCNLFVDTTELAERSDPANSIIACFITLATFEIVQAVKRWCFGRMKRIQSNFLHLLLVLGLLVCDSTILLLFLCILYSSFLGCIGRDEYPFDIALTASTHGVTLFIIVVSCGRSILDEGMVLFFEGTMSLPSSYILIDTQYPNPSKTSVLGDNQRQKSYRNGPYPLRKLFHQLETMRRMYSIIFVSV